jgi:hypothetical protein
MSKHHHVQRIVSGDSSSIISAFGWDFGLKSLCCEVYKHMKSLLRFAEIWFWDKKISFSCCLLIVDSHRQIPMIALRVLTLRSDLCSLSDQSKNKKPQLHAIVDNLNGRNRYQILAKRRNQFSDNLSPWPSFPIRNYSVLIRNIPIWASLKRFWPLNEKRNQTDMSLRQWNYFHCCVYHQWGNSVPTEKIDHLAIRPFLYPDREEVLAWRSTAEQG